MISPLFHDLRHDLFRICVFIALNSLLCNVLPPVARFKLYPRFASFYRVFVDIVAGFALNWRVRLPSLSLEFLGFRIRRNRIDRNKHL